MTQLGMGNYDLRIGVEGFEVLGEVAALDFSLLDGVELFEDFVYFFR